MVGLKSIRNKNEILISSCRDERFIPLGAPGPKAEDGPIGGQYHLVETPSANFLQRTEWNARDSDGTVVFTRIGHPLFQNCVNQHILRIHAGICLT